MSTPAVAVAAVPRQRALFAVLFAGFILTGVAISVVGPLLPVFIARWSLGDSKAGLFSTVPFAASLCGVGLSSLLTKCFGYRPAIITGYVLMSVGLVSLNASLLAIALVGAAAIGLGYGMAVPGTNLCVAEMAGTRSASLVSVVNLAWGIGAVSCSPLVMFSLKLHLLPQMLVGIAVFGCVLTLVLLFAAAPAEKHANSPAVDVAVAPRIGPFVTIALATLFFIYVGTEVSFSFWAATYANRLSAGLGEVSTVAPMFFFGGLMGGRAFTPLALAKIRENRLALGALCVVVLGAALLVASSTQRAAFVSLAIAGLGCACLFPIYIAWLSRWYAARAKVVSALMFSMASIGAATVPWLVGFVSGHAGGLRVGLLVPLVDAFLMILLLVLLRRQTAA
jgi:FHS family glucose/mannose:H+ symporter-like MFS transporter